jgi:type I restriction enzyme S subunit
MLCDKIFRLRYVKEAVDPRFLAWSLQSTVARQQIEREATGSSGSMQNIGQDTVRQLVLAWPQVDEQRRIAQALAAMLSRVDLIQERLELTVSKLREYRQALITAAVTGKIDVTRESAPSSVPAPAGA